MFAVWLSFSRRFIVKGLTLYSGICYNEIISLKTSLLWILTLFGQILFLINKCIILLSLVLEIERVISKKKIVTNIESVFKNYLKKYHQLLGSKCFVLVIYNKVSTQYDDLGKKNLIESNIIIVRTIRIHCCRVVACSIVLGWF